VFGNILKVETSFLNDILAKQYEMKNHKVTVPRVGLFRKPLLSFSSSARKIEKRTALQIGRWTGTDCVREAHCDAVPRRVERRDDLICVFLSSYTLIWSFCRTRMRMPRSHILTQYTQPITSTTSQTFSFVSTNFDIGTFEGLLGWLAKIQIKNTLMKGDVSLSKYNES